LAGGAFQVVARLREVLLAQTQHAEAAQGVTVGGAGFEHAAETRFGGFQVAIVQGAEGLLGALAQRVGARAFGAAGLLLLALDLVQSGLHGGVAREGAQELLVQRDVGAAAAGPGQGLAPALDGGAADVGMAGQPCQVDDAFATGGVAVGQVLGQGQRDAGIVGLFLGQLLQALARRLPALGGAAQGLVILQGQRTARGLTTQGILVGVDRLGRFAGLGQVAGRLQLRPVAHHVDRLLDVGQARVAGGGFLELGDVFGGLVKALVAGFDHGHAAQGFRLVGVELEQLLPGFGRTLTVFARLPVLALLQQGFDGGLLGEHGWHTQCGQQAHG